MLEQLNTTAQIFYEHVASARGESADHWRSLKGGSFIGADAKERGMVVAILGFDDLLSEILGKSPMAIKASDDNKPDMKALRAQLQQMADAGDEKCKAALAALDGEESPKDEDKKDDSDKDKASDSESEPPKDDEDKDSSKATMAALKVANTALTTVRALETEIKTRDEAKERANLLAGRPDLEPALRATLEKSTTPLALVREACAEWPRGTTGANALEAANAANNTQPSVKAAGSGTATYGKDYVPRQSPEEFAAMQARMGISPEGKTKITHGNGISTFSVLGK
jgi:hypothetical protein